MNTHEAEAFELKRKIRHEAAEIMRAKRREAYDEYVRIRDESVGHPDMNKIRAEAWKEVERIEAETSAEYDRNIANLSTNASLKKKED